MIEYVVRVLTDPNALFELVRWGGYVALVTMYLPLTQTLNVRLAASRDGRRWWFPDRRPCLDNARAAPGH